MSTRHDSGLAKKRKLAAAFFGRSMPMLATTGKAQRLLNTFTVRLANSRSLSTWEVRVRGIDKFWAFCTEHKLGPPFNLIVLADSKYCGWLGRAFAIHLMETGGHSAMKEAMRAVNTLFSLRGLTPIMKTMDIAQLLDSHKRTLVNPKKQMLGLEDFMIKAVYDVWFKDRLNVLRPSHVMLLFFFYVIRMGLLRAGGAGRICWAAVLVTDRGVHTCIDKHKTGQTEGKKIDLPFTGSPYCFRPIFMAWMRMCGGRLARNGRVIGAQGLVFRPIRKTSHRSHLIHIDYTVDLGTPNFTFPLNTGMMNSFLRSALVQVVGLTPTEARLVSGHSGRIAGLNSGANMGALDLAIDVGHWRARASALGYSCTAGWTRTSAWTQSHRWPSFETLHTLHYDYLH